MFVLVDKINKKIYASNSKKEIAKESGINYNTLNYYSSKGFYESLSLIFSKVTQLKSKQGGKRKTAP